MNRKHRKYLLLDCNYLCHRAKHTTGELTYKGKATGAMYGFLKSLAGFQDLFNTSNFIFCWDSKTNKRKEIFPEYKAHRVKKEYTDKEIKFDRAFRKQMKKLRTTYLSMIGFKNIFVQKGYESDDVIASICKNISADEEAIILSSDSDLYQCIRPNVSFYNLQKGRILTFQGFKKTYGIESYEWGNAKSLAGCSTDGVPGIKGVGILTAIKFLRNELNPDSKAMQSIKHPDSDEIFLRNLKLIVLPFEGIKKFKLRRDKLSEQGWKQVTKMLGMRSIKDKMPFEKRKRKCVSREKLLKN